MAEDSNEFVPPPLAGFQKKMEDAVKAAETEQQPGRSVSDVVFDAMKEVAERDTDDDGVPDVREQALGTNPLDPDTDDDGLADGVEINAGLDPTVREVPKYEDPDDAAHDNPFGDVKLPVPPGLSLPETPSKRSAPSSHQPVQPSELPEGGRDFDGRRAFLDHALDQVGDKGQFGAEVRPDADDADAWDSGELVEWAAKQAGVDDMPDGTWRQYRYIHEHGGDLDPAQALRVPGALLFKFSSDPLKQGSIPSERQVFISLGDGHVVQVTEAGGVEVVEASPSDFKYAGAIRDFPTSTDTLTAQQVTDKLGELDIDPGTFESGPSIFSPGAMGHLAGLQVLFPPTVDRGLNLAKQAEDLRDQSDALRIQVDDAEGRAQALETQADDLRGQADAKAAAALEASAAGDPGAAAMQAEADALRVQAGRLDEQLGRMNSQIGTMRQEASALDSSAHKLDLDANEILSQLAAPPPQTPGSAEPGEEREQRSEEEFENIAESRRVAAGVADGRAAEARARIAAEQERIQDLDGRLAQAQARADEYAAQHRAAEDEWERLNASRDPAAGAVAQRADKLMQEQLAQDAEVSRLKVRRDVAVQNIAQQTDNASDYDEIAADLRAGAADADKAAALHRDALDAGAADDSDVVGDTPGSAAAASTGTPLSMNLDRDDDDADTDTDTDRETDDGLTQDSAGGVAEEEADPAAVQQQIAAIDNSADSLMVDDADLSVSDATEPMDTMETRDSLDDDFDTIA